MIAATRSLDETSLVHGRLGFWHAMVVVLDGYGVGIADRFSRTVVRPGSASDDREPARAHRLRPCRPTTSRAERPASQSSVVLKRSDG